MSHDATNWAIKQRGFKPATKFVLWHLCDRYHPDNGCFPSQETLAEDCELSRSALNEHLAILENAGLIAREQRREKGSKQQLSTRYRFAFEPGFAPVCREKPCTESGHGSDDDAVSGNGAEPCPENGQSRVRNPDSNPVREPVIEPVNLREGASEREGGSATEAAEPVESAKAIERDFKRWFPTWPTYVSDSEPEARKAWFELSAEERTDAADRQADYLEEARKGGRTKNCSAAVYLRERRWQKLAPKPVVVEPPKIAAPFGKAWGAARMAALLKPAQPLPGLTVLEERIIGQNPEKERIFWQDKKLKHGWPQAVTMHEAASAGRGVTVKADAIALGEDFQQVMVGGELWEAWKRFHAARCWPWLPDPGRLQWVWFPAIDDGWTDMDGAVAAAVERFRRRVEGHVHAAAE